MKITLYYIGTHYTSADILYEIMKPDMSRKTLITLVILYD